MDENYGVYESFFLLSFIIIVPIQIAFCFSLVVKIFSLPSEHLLDT